MFIVEGAAARSLAASDIVVFGMCFCVPALLLVAQAAKSTPRRLFSLFGMETLKRVGKSTPQLARRATVLMAEGTPKSIAGFVRPRTFPDFTRCDQTTSEVDTAYKAVIVHGGPYRGFSQIMPVFLRSSEFAASR